MIYTVYVLYSAKYDKIYIGYTSNIASRLLSHNELGKKGWTIRYRPWTLVYTEAYKDKLEAFQREQQLKGAQGRVWVRELIRKYFG